jgi:hypothetical protein
MRRTQCWVIENYRYKPCPRPRREFRALVSLHNHSRYSFDDLTSLNGVMSLWFMRPFQTILQRAFGLEGVPDLNYAELLYNPPFAPADVLRVESEAARHLGFDNIQLAITDHDEVAGSVELRQCRPSDGDGIALGEELSFRFRRRLFHLGITGLPEKGIAETHRALQSAARQDRLDDLFETLSATGCLVVLNHPLISWGHGRESEMLVRELLKRYGWAIHALEYNGMRRREENDRVLELARQLGKPVVGGGDSHLLLASSTLCASPGAGSFAEFIEEVKSGLGMPLIKSDYFAPLRWKLFLRVLAFIAHYRQIAHFRGEPIQRRLEKRTVLLDPVGRAAGIFLRLISALGWAR